MNTISQLLNNPAFWVFLGTAITAYYGYKAVVKKSPAQKQKIAIKKANSFEELKAVVEILQGELTKKDKRHLEDTEYILGQLRHVRVENRELTVKLAESLKDNAVLHEEISGLKALFKKHEIRLNNAHISENGDK